MSRNYPYYILATLCLVTLLIFQSQPSDQLELTFLDVGQGDAILVRTPQNQKILIDAGPAGEILPRLSEELRFFERQIDLIVLTHPDTDHIAGFVEILKRYEVKHVLLTGAQHNTEWYRGILTQIAEQEIPTIIAQASSDFDLGNGVLLDVFWPLTPLAGQIPADSNAASISVRLSFGQTAVILTGDLDVASEEEILETEQNLSAQVLKLGHHGSRTANSAALLTAVNPEIAIVSAGAENKFGHPHTEVLERLVNQQILETSKEGNIKLVSDGKSWSMK